MEVGVVLVLADALPVVRDRPHFALAELLDSGHTPESRFPMMVSSPYLAVSQADHGGTSPSLAS